MDELELKNFYSTVEIKVKLTEQVRKYYGKEISQNSINPDEKIKFEKKNKLKFLSYEQDIIEWRISKKLIAYISEKIGDKFTDILSGITFNTSFFSIKMDEETDLKKNAFAIIEKNLYPQKKEAFSR